MSDDEMRTSDCGSTVIVSLESEMKMFWYRAHIRVREREYLH